MVSAGEVIRASDVAVQACRVTRTTAQSIPEGSAASVVNFDDEFFDTDGMHDTVTNNSRITINTAGIYIFGFNGSFAADDDYTRILAAIRANGSTELARDQNPTTPAGNLQQLISVGSLARFDVGDYIEAQVFQLGTALARNLEVIADRSPVFWAARIGS